MRFLEYPSSSFEKLAFSSQEVPEKIRARVSDIVRRVRKNGDHALLDLTWRFDRVLLKKSELRVSAKEMVASKVSPALKTAARATLRDVTAFARSSLPVNWNRRNAHGAKVGEKFDPLFRVGIYIPGGSVPLVSSVFMTVALAREAGVSEIVVCTPPPVATELLWAMRVCGATEVWRLGGAQAIAAMAYGTKMIRAVDKIFGPGNVFVTEAKRQVFGKVGIDLLAGPSELMLLADETTHVAWAAADLLAQAEHGSGRELIYCVSASARVLEKIRSELLRQAKTHASNPGLKKVLMNGTFWIRTCRHEQLSDVANRLAPEHLQIMTSNAQRLASRVTTAGGIFLGNNTPTVLGDFAAGPSHTLPTSGAGRSFSGLRVVDFKRRTSVISYTRQELQRARKQIEAFSKAESLPAHGDSLRIRLGG